MNHRANELTSLEKKFKLSAATVSAILSHGTQHRVLLLHPGRDVAVVTGDDRAARRLNIAEGPGQVGTAEADAEDAGHAEQAQQHDRPRRLVAGRREVVAPTFAG